MQLSAQNFSILSRKIYACLSSFATTLCFGAIVVGWHTKRPVFTPWQRLSHRCVWVAGLCKMMIGRWSSQTAGFPCWSLGDGATGQTMQYLSARLLGIGFCPVPGPWPGLTLVPGTLIHTLSTDAMDLCLSVEHCVSRPRTSRDTLHAARDTSRVQHISLITKTYDVLVYCISKLWQKGPHWTILPCFANAYNLILLPITQVCKALSHDDLSRRPLRGTQPRSSETCRLRSTKQGSSSGTCHGLGLAHCQVPRRQVVKPENSSHSRPCRSNTCALLVSQWLQLRQTLISAATWRM